jgi:hypothetical protein
VCDRASVLLVGLLASMVMRGTPAVHRFDLFGVRKRPSSASRASLVVVAGGANTDGGLRQIIHNVARKNRHHPSNPQQPYIHNV